jgi:hypothetical protein
VGLFEDAQHAKSTRDAAHRQKDAAASANAAKEEAGRISQMATDRRLLLEFVAEMSRLGVPTASHRSTYRYHIYTDGFLERRKAVSGWSLGDCSGCNRGAKRKYRGCGVVVGRDGLLYRLEDQPSGIFSQPKPMDSPLGGLEAQLTTALSRHL